MRKLGLVLCALLVLTGCSLPGLGGDASNDDIVIAGGNTSERQILSEILKQMIVHHMPDKKVSLINNLGSSVLIHQAMTHKDANISAAMYTGTSLTGELGYQATTDPRQALQQVVEGYQSQFNMVWFPSYGFANTYAFMVRKDFAEENNISKVSDLEAFAGDLKAGVDTGWMNREGDGYKAFKEVYEFDFKAVMPMEIGLVYEAVRSSTMDVVLGYSTDGRIAAYDLIVLEDDRELFPPYDASPVVTEELLQKHPEIETVLLRLEGEITSEIMQKLNQTSDEMKVEPQVVATQFLEEHQYFESKAPQKLSEYPLYQERGNH